MIRHVMPTLAALAVLGVLAVWVRVHETGDPPDPTQGEAILQIPRDRLEQIEIRGEKGETVLERRGARWTLARPVEDAPDPGRLEELLGRFERFAARRRLSFEGERPDRARMGLEDPSIRVTWRAGGTEGEIRVGAVSPVESSRYVTLAGSTDIWMVDPSSLDAFDASPNAYRRQQVYPLDVARQKALEIEFPDDRRLAFEREEDGAGETWTGRVPGPFPADTAAVRNLLFGLSAIRVDRFEDDAPGDLARYGLDHPRYVVSATDTDRTLRTLAVGAVCPDESTKTWVRAGDRRFVYRVATTAFQALQGGATAFRDRRLFRFAPHEVTGLTVSREPIEARVARSGPGTWTFLDAAVDADATAHVPPLLEALAGLRARSFDAAPPAEASTATRPLDIELTLQPTASGTVSAPRVVGLELLPVGPGEHRVRVDGLEAAVVPEEDPWQKARAVLDDFMTVVALDRPSVARIRIVARGQELVLVRDGKDWHPDPTGPTWTDLPGSAGRFLDMLLGLAADRFEPAAEAPPFEADYRIELTGPPDRVTRITIGPETAGRRPLRVEGSAWVAVVDAARVTGPLEELLLPYR